MSTDQHGNALCERCHASHIFYQDSERYCQSCLLAIEIEYDAKIAREEAQSLYNSDSGVDADDYRAYMDANAPELIDPQPAPVVQVWSPRPISEQAETLDTLIKAQHELMDTLEYASLEYRAEGYTLMQLQLRLERIRHNQELDTLKADYANACEALKKLAIETDDHPLAKIDPYHAGFKVARNAAFNIAEDGLIKANYYIRQLRAE